MDIETHEIKQQPDQVMAPIWRTCTECERLWGLNSLICPVCSQPTDVVYDLKYRDDVD